MWTSIAGAAAQAAIEPLALGALLEYFELTAAALEQVEARLGRGRPLSHQTKGYLVSASRHMHPRTGEPRLKAALRAIDAANLGIARDVANTIEAALEHWFHVFGRRWVAAHLAREAPDLESSLREVLVATQGTPHPDAFLIILRTSLAQLIESWVKLRGPDFVERNQGRLTRIETGWALTMLGCGLLLMLIQTWLYQIRS